MKDKLQFPFKRKGDNYLELLEDLGKDTMLGVKTVRATARNTAIYFDDDGYTIQDAKKLARAIHDTYSDVTATADIGRNPYGEEVPFVFVDKVNSFMRESKMKKLNITKEQFEKSRYFTKKYGKLEYVSESGKLFKTEKGNVLKFVKESCDEEFDRYYERMKKIFRYDSGIHIRMRDNEDGSETIEVTFDDRFDWNDDVVSGRIPLDEDSLLLDWITRFDEQAHRNGWEFDYELADDIETPIDGGAGNDYLAKLTLTCKCDKEEDDLLFENSGESVKKFGKKFKESASDIANDPAYKCPYCGSTDCEFDTAEDIGTGLTEGYFDGATFNAQYFCNKCGKPYNVQFQLKVKDVYPNEDADEFGDKDVWDADEDIWDDNK